MVKGDFLYVTDSLYRIDILYLLDSIDYARNYEIANILHLAQTHTFQILDGLCSRDIVQSEKVESYRIYFLTNKGKELVKKIRGYHGLN